MGQLNMTAMWPCSHPIAGGHMAILSEEEGNNVVECPPAIGRIIFPHLDTGFLHFQCSQ